MIKQTKQATVPGPQTPGALRAPDLRCVNNLFVEVLYFMYTSNNLFENLLVMCTTKKYVVPLSNSDNTTM